MREEATELVLCAICVCVYIYFSFLFKLVQERECTFICMCAIKGSGMSVCLSMDA